jgi:hypothetical protein
LFCTIAVENTEAKMAILVLGLYQILLSLLLYPLIPTSQAIPGGYGGTGGAGYTGGAGGGGAGGGEDDDGAKMP